ncbi:MAG: hypothetical protein ACXAC5_04545 [Promethearchaeota archaeon]|jgi:hypothetical protein
MTLENKTIYWAVLLVEHSKKKLLRKHKPYHPNIYAEHMTIVFNPTPEQDELLMKQIGQHRTLMVTGFRFDEKGDAVVVTGERRPNGGIPHITISCADGTKPFYSNKVLDGGWNFSEPFEIHGTIARYTKKGWDHGT